MEKHNDFEHGNFANMPKVFIMNKL
jgi:hypothetical protein